MVEKITIITEDKVEIVGSYLKAQRSKAIALLLHMLPATKESWSKFAELLADKGVSSLSIDLRGHGESVKKGDQILDYKLFENEDHQASKIDVKAATEWLFKKDDVGADRLAVVGASIGSNLAIRLTAEMSDIPVCVALSPGLDYKGVTSDDALRSIRPGQSVLIAVSEEDEVSVSSVRQLETIKTKAELKFVYLSGAGHGTTMFERDPDFMNETLDWLVEHLLK